MNEGEKERERIRGEKKMKGRVKKERGRKKET